MNVDSLHRSSRKYDSDDETEVTQSSSHSSDNRRSRNRNRRDRSSTRSSSRPRETPRSKSHSVRPDYRTSRTLERMESEEKHRSRSFSRSHRVSGFDALPAVQLPENTLIQVKEEDDDMSAISAGTLEQMDRLQILQHANKSLKKRQQPAAPRVTSDVFEPVFDLDKENIVNCSSPDRSRYGATMSQSGQSRVSSVGNLSMASSAGTSEFESVWNTPTKLAASRQKRGDDIVDADNYHLQGKHPSRSRSGPRSRRVPFETPNTRKMKRQIQRDWIGTIAEDIYANEEEI